MDILAHNGVGHATDAQAAAHAAMHPALAVVIVTILVTAFIVTAFYVVHRFTTMQLPIRDKEN